MSQQWYIRRQGQVYGPYTSSTLNVDSVLPTDELSQSQQGPWKPAASFASYSRDASGGNLQEENPKPPKAVKVNNPKQWDTESEAIYFLRRNGQISKPLSGRDLEKFQTSEDYYVMIHLNLIHMEMVNFYDVEAVLKYVNSLDDDEWFECDQEKFERRMHALKVEAELEASLTRQNTARTQVEIAKMEGQTALIQILVGALVFGMWAWYFFKTYG